MPPSVLHFGSDENRRLPVLRSVGYSVALCPDLTEFRPALQRAEPDAVLLAAKPDKERREVIALTRAHSHAGLVLFDDGCSHAEEEAVDVVIPPLTRPEEWLRQIADVIAKSVALKAAAAVTSPVAKSVSTVNTVRKQSRDRLWSIVH